MVKIMLLIPVSVEAYGLATDAKLPPHYILMNIRKGKLQMPQKVKRSVGPQYWHRLRDMIPYHARAVPGDTSFKSPDVSPKDVFQR